MTKEQIEEELNIQMKYMLEAMKTEQIVFVTQAIELENKYGVKYLYTGMARKIPSVNKLSGGQDTYLPSGIGRCLFFDCTIHEGMFKDGQAVGYQRIYYSDGSKYIGTIN